MCALLGMVDVLAADRETWNGAGGALDQDRRNAQGHVDIRIVSRGRGNRPNLVEVGRQAVHLPIAGNELLQHHFPYPFERH